MREVRINLIGGIEEGGGIVIGGLMMKENEAHCGYEEADNEVAY